MWWIPLHRILFMNYARGREPSDSRRPFTQAENARDGRASVGPPKTQAQHPHFSTTHTTRNAALASQSFLLKIFSYCFMRGSHTQTHTQVVCMVFPSHKLSRLQSRRRGFSVGAFFRWDLCSIYCTCIYLGAMAPKTGVALVLCTALD